MDKHRLNRLAAMLKEASAGREHGRIQGDLDRWAQERGFTQALSASLPRGGRPDVLRFDGARQYLFVGDAKDSENETTANLATSARISGYMVDFADLIGDREIRGGYFAIATNSEREAGAWVVRLNLLATLQGLTDGPGAGPSFRVDQIAAMTWVAWW